MKKIFLVLICGLLILDLSTDCEDSYGESDARNDLINYLEKNIMKNLKLL